MPVVRIDIHDAEDLNGAPLGTIEDTDLKAFSIRATRAKYENGSGQIVMSRHNALAQLLLPGRLARVYVPVIHATDCIHAFFLQEDETVLQGGEADRGGENITMNGLGPFDYLRNAMLDSTQNGSGSFAPSEGQWRAQGLYYTDLLEQMLDEDAGNTTPALIALTHDFTPSLDSIGLPSPIMNDEFVLDIGTDYSTAFRVLGFTDDGLEYIVDPGTDGAPQLLLQAFSVYGVDRTGTSWAPTIVRFVAPDNIFEFAGNLLTEVKRKGRGQKRGSHALVGGKDGAYRMVVRPDWAPPEPVRRIFVSAPETNSNFVMDRIGIRALNERTNAQDIIELEFIPGDDEDNGLYVPYKHFRPGDMVTLDTGAGFKDYEDRALKVQAWRLSLATAVSDASDDSSFRSLKVAVELGTTVAGSGPLTPGCCDGPGSQVHPPNCNCAATTIPITDVCGTSVGG